MMKISSDVACLLATLRPFVGLVAWIAALVSMVAMVVAAMQTIGVHLR